MDDSPSFLQSQFFDHTGASGITVAAELKRHNPGLDIAIVEPSGLHWYQPGWTLVGAGVFRRQQTEWREERLIPKSVAWIRAAAASFHPDENVVRLGDEKVVTDLPAVREVTDVTPFFPTETHPQPARGNLLIAKCVERSSMSRLFGRY
jgi:hypothetical protein